MEINRRTVVGILVLLVACLVATPVVHAATPDEVDASVDRAVDYLFKCQKPNGSWETTGRPDLQNPPNVGDWVRWGGETAAAVHGLLFAYRNAYTPQIKRAVEWLAQEELHGTYSVALRAEAMGLLPMQMRYKDKSLLLPRDYDVAFVLGSRIQEGPDKGFYGYTYGTDAKAPDKPGAFPALDPKGPPPNAHVDRSNSIFALIAAVDLERAGAEIPMEFWKEEDAAWRGAQLLDGGWNYSSGQSTFNMTCAGVLALHLTQGYITRADWRQFEKPEGGKVDANIERGLAWLDLHADQIPKLDPYGFSLFARLGQISGRQRFGNIKWFKAGADALISRQAPDGGWGSEHDTNFAIEFLCLGRMPMAMNKLRYGKDDSWNQRPRDVANWCRIAGPHLCARIGWSLVDVDALSEAWQDAPILYMAGSRPIELSDEQLQKLREYIERGGLILGNADGGSPEFSASFRAMCGKMFPKYTFRKLAPDHLIFNEMYHYRLWKVKPILESMTNGVREICILLPTADAGFAWQTESWKVRDYLFELGTDLSIYSWRDMYFHAQYQWPKTPTTRPANQIKVARIVVGENPDPEPGAWRRMASLAGEDLGFSVIPELTPLAPASLNQYKVAHLTGTTQFSLSAEQRAEIKAFVERGGTLLVDAAGGNAAFAKSAEAELIEMFGQSAQNALAAPLPLSHAIYSSRKKIAEIVYNKFTRRNLEGGIHEPRLVGIPSPNDANRIAVFYSRLDITAGCLGRSIDGIMGYDPETATDLMISMIAYGSGKR